MTRFAIRRALSSAARALAIVGACTALAGLASAQDAPPKPPAPKPGDGKAKQAEPPVTPNRDYYFLDEEMIRNKDGTLTWFYLTNHVAATHLGESLQKLKIPGLATDTRKRYAYSFPHDMTRGRSNISTSPVKRAETDENLLILTFHPAYKDVVEEFLQRFDIPEAQVYIKAKVVEVSLDSNLEYGVSLFFDRGGGDPGGNQIGSDNPNAFFRGFRSAFRPASFGSPFLSPDNTGLSLVFDDLLGGEGSITAQIEALQERGTANILSEPSIVATQGHLATLLTGQETPISEIRITGTSETVLTDFKETGIRLDFTPLHIGREYVKLRVRVEVSSITGFVEASGLNTVTQNPIIAQRNSETVVSIRDGMTLVIGGLYSISQIENRAGLPILGDIPVLRYLFSRTRKTKVKSELDFFITPRILRHRLDKSVFMPPMERRRLKGLKKRE